MSTNRNWTRWLRNIGLLLTVIYLLSARNCMRMDQSEEETATFFEEKGVAYRSETLDIEGHRLHFVETGNEEAENLVFLHGSPGSWSAFEGYMADDSLLRRFRLLAPDRPGFGQSEFWHSEDLSTQSNRLGAWLERVGRGKKTTLVGHSYGGPLVVRMAIDYPDLVDRVVILAGALDPEAEKPERWRVPLCYFPLKYFVPGALKPSNDELWMLKADLHELEPELPRLVQDVLIIHGTEDRLVPYRNMDYMMDRFTGVRSLEAITLDGERHFIVWDQKEMIVNQLLTWDTDEGKTVETP